MVFFQKTIIQEGTVCDPKGRSCIDNVIQQTYNCKTSCQGIYADVFWINEEVGCVVKNLVIR